MLLNERVYKSGYNSDSADLILAAYLRTGLFRSSKINGIKQTFLILTSTISTHIKGAENRPKDLGRFFFWMSVRGKDLQFLVAVLSNTESACQVDSTEVTDIPVDTETSYGKRKRQVKEAGDQTRKEQMLLLKEIMCTPENNVGSASSNSMIDNSVVQRNLASANEKEAKSNTEKVNNLMKVMSNDIIFGMYTDEEKDSMRNELKRLICE